MKTWRPLNFLGLLPAALLLALLAGDPTTSSAPTPAGAPFQIVATGFEKPTGVVLHPEGFLLLTDQETGVLYRLTPGLTAAGAPAFSSEVLFSGLDEPIGVAVDRDGHLLVAESDKGRVVRFGKLGAEVFSAVPESVMTGLKDPRWLAVDGEGTIFLSAEGVKQEKLPKGTPKPRDDVLLKITLEGTLHVVADGFKALSGLAFDHAGDLFAGAKRRRGDKEKPEGTIFKIRLPEGTVSPVVAGGFKEPRDLEVDVLGALFFTAKEFREERDSDKDDDDERDDDRGETRSSGGHETKGRNEDANEDQDDDEPSRPGKWVILKAAFKPDGSLQSLTPLARGLRRPAGVAFDQDGNLYVAEGNHGRVLRFQAPAPPTVLEPASPAFTNQPMLTVRGTAEPNARVTVLGAASPVTGQADMSSGAFAIDVSLTPNVKQTFRVHATAARGDGLTGPATEVVVTHDDIPPDTIITDGPSGTLNNTMAMFTFEATEAGSTFLCQLDGGGFATCTSPKSYTGLTPGNYTFKVRAIDRAGNEDESPAARDFTVISGPTITITTPADGATIGGNSVQVRGTVTGAVGDVGVSVNGFVANVNEGQWATEIPLGAGSNVLQVIATDAGGSQSTNNITVTSSGGNPLLVLQASPDNGVTTLVVKWQVVNLTGRPLIQFQFDETGAGNFGDPTATFEGVQTTYSTPGLRFPTIRATDDQETMYTATTIVSVEDPQTVTARFQSRWQSFKNRLQARDIQGALDHLTPSLQERFRPIFQQLNADLPAIVEGLGNIEVLDQLGDLAETVIVQQENGTSFLYFIYFQRDSLGRWLIEEM